MALYNAGDFALTIYSFLSSNGKLSEAYQLSIDFGINTGFTYMTLDDESRVSILRNVQMGFQKENANRNFLMQFDEIQSMMVL